MRFGWVPVVALVVTVPVATPGVAAGAVPLALPAECSGRSPVVCHYPVRPGNYDVTVSMGAAGSAGDTSIWAEARRLMLPAGSTAARYSFTVNVRQPEGQPTGQGGTGTPGLDIRFAGSAPGVAARPCMSQCTQTSGVRIEKRMLANRFTKKGAVASVTPSWDE